MYQSLRLLNSLIVTLNTSIKNVSSQKKNKFFVNFIELKKYLTGQCSKLHPDQSECLNTVIPLTPAIAPLN